MSQAVGDAGLGIFSVLRRIHGLQVFTREVQPSELRQIQTRLRPHDFEFLALLLYSRGAAGR